MQNGYLLQYVHKQYPEITFNDDLNIDYACVDACPKKLLKANKKKGKLKLLILNCTLCKACERACRKQLVKDEMEMNFLKIH